MIFFVKARAKESNDPNSKSIGSDGGGLLLKSRILQQFRDGLEKAIAVSADTMPSQLVMLASSISKPRVSCPQIRVWIHSISAFLRQIFHGVFHRKKTGVHQEKTSKRKETLLY